ncbi:hypothetical protein GCM10010238_42480 [Streptomyces griseoviridis]|uniref:Uncharacterized protein n=1 Tax=Streptomyces griseoviridis TaxID=45398 RepID=A0A918GN85_STRGD|nr:hypothetical protein GCM10010238_42480 [Streptomyces niveoruber]
MTATRSARQAVAGPARPGALGVIGTGTGRWLAWPGRTAVTDALGPRTRRPARRVRGPVAPEPDGP